MWPAMANAPVSPVYPDALGLTGTVVSPNTDAREVDPLGVDTQGQGSAASRGRCTCECSMSYKESDRVMATHKLRMAEGGTCQDTKRKRQNEDSPVLTL